MFTEKQTAGFGRILNFYNVKTTQNNKTLNSLAIFYKTNFFIIVNYNVCKL